MGRLPRGRSFVVASLRGAYPGGPFFSDSPVFLSISFFRPEEQLINPPPFEVLLPPGDAFLPLDRDFHEEALPGLFF